ncbi:MAG: hypothetical protein ABIH82_04030 [Candidatus Woesearchaeota archaeon]
MKNIRGISSIRAVDSFMEGSGEDLIWTNRYAIIINDPQLEQAIRRIDPKLREAAAEYRHTFSFDCHQRGYNGLIATRTNHPAEDLGRTVKEHDIQDEFEMVRLQGATKKDNVVFLRDRTGYAYTVRKDVHDYLVNMCNTENVWKARRGKQAAALYFDDNRIVRGLLLPMALEKIALPDITL